jgi:hypothetical protein
MLLKKAGLMADKPRVIAYVDHTIFTTIAQSFSEDERIFHEQQAIHSLWRHHKEESIRLVSCGKDIESDLIFWFNKQGCCVTDTLRARDAIDEFDRWGMIPRETIRRYKQALMFFEQIDSLPQVFNEQMEYNREQNAYMLALKEILMKDTDEKTMTDFKEEIESILEECARNLHMWYTEEDWANLKRTDYKLNWDILKSTLLRINRKPIFDGKEGEHVRYLFGLLNRTIGLTKKSCPKLPVEKGHRNFIITTVMKKYTHYKEERNARHIYNCISHGINLLLTTDDDLITTFNKKKHLLTSYPGLPYTKLTLLLPSELEDRLVSNRVK